jgi:hypothetical protein
VPVIFAVILLFSLSIAENDVIGSIDPFAERMGAGSRALARGNAMVADSSAFFTAYWNPGMLAFKRDISLALHGEMRSSSRHGGAFGIEGGTGNKMGIGTAILFRGDEKSHIYEYELGDSDSTYKGYSAPFFMLSYVSLGYRISKKDGLGISSSTIYKKFNFSKKINYANDYRSPLLFNLGWFRFWNAKWQSGTQIRNLGFDDSRPGVFEARVAFDAGLTHRNLLLSKPVSVSLMLFSYPKADTLINGRFGFEMETVKNGDLRFGIDGKNPSAGLGYAFNINGKTLFADYAIIYEWEAGQLNPLSLSLRMRF